MTSIDSIHSLSDALLNARVNSSPYAISGDFPPISLAEALAVDDRVAAQLDQPVLGWKIGCTSEMAQTLLGADGPFSGRVYSLAHTGTTYSDGEISDGALLEGEFAFSIGRDIEPHMVTGDDSDRELVADSIATVHPAIEVVGGRYDAFVGTPCNFIIADSGANEHLVIGDGVAWTNQDLRGMEATMNVDGSRTGKGHGSDVLGDPVNALTWLVQHLAVRQITLAEGQVVTTGTATQVATFTPGSTAMMVVKGLGSVTVSRS